MKKLNLILSATTLCSLLSLAGCDNGVSNSTTATSNKSSTSSIVANTNSNISTSSPVENLVTFELTVKSINGDRLNNVTIKIYKDSTLIKTVVTDYLGNAKVNIPKDTYTVILENLPLGMYSDENYTLSGNGGKVTFECLSSVIDQDVPANNTYNLGSLMYDFTMTDTEGNTHTLSEILETKRIAVLNFWYIDCYWCGVEFPHFVDAYSLFSDDLEILALNINPYDSMSEISDYKLDYEIPFPVGKDSTGIFDMFGFTGAPSTVIVNQYGIATYIHSGALTTFDEVCDLFDEYINA